MSTEHSDGTASPDEFDRQLRDLYSGSAGAARFREPSAAERARRAARRRRKSLKWQLSRQARKLRKPVPPGSPKLAQPARSRRPPKPLGRGQSGPVRPPAPGDRRRRMRSLAKGTGILFGFVALLVLMHVLGLGPH